MPLPQKIKAAAISRAEKHKWLRHCPAALNVGSSARSFKMIGGKTTLLKVKKQGRQ